MRRAALALAALVVVLAATAVALSGAGQASTKPQLRLMDADVLTVRATGFRSREHVYLVVRAPALITRDATAGTGGGFTMRLAGVSPSVCTGFSITASGNHGSRATLKRAPGQCALP
jgi:hypothetical protein